MRRTRLFDFFGGLLVIVGALASIATNLADSPDEDDGGGLVACSSGNDCAGSERTPHCLTSYEVCVECLDDDHCDEHSRCFESRCTARCASHDACPGELVCVEGLCRTCESDSECGDPGQYCYVGPELNACRPLCSGSSDCTGTGYVDGEVCRAGQCQQVSCRVPQDCLLDREVCDVQEGVCRAVL